MTYYTERQHGFASTYYYDAGIRVYVTAATALARQLAGNGRVCQVN